MKPVWNILLVINMFEIELIKKYLQVNHQMELFTFGNSMYPTIKKGDKIIVQNIDDAIILDDIVLFFEENDTKNTLIAHRVIGIIDGKFYIIKGDNNNYSDRPIRRTKIIGKVIGIVHSKEEE